MLRSSKLALRRQHTGSFAGDEMQRLAQQNARQTNAMPFNGSVLIDAEPDATARSGLQFAAGVARSIAHGLGRKAVGFSEVYGADTPSANIVGLHASAHPAGVSSDTHVTVTPTFSGACFLVVF